MLAMWCGLLLWAMSVYCVEGTEPARILLSDLDYMCLINTTDETKNCLVDGTPNDRKKAVDFHFNRGEIYRAFAIEGGVLIERQTLDLGYTVNKLFVEMDQVESSTDTFTQVEDLSVDWVHDKIYLIVNTTSGSKLLKMDLPEVNASSSIRPTVILSRDDVAREGGVPASTMVLKRVEVDPYEGTLYIVGQDYPDSKYVSTTTVCRANLDGSNLRKLIRKALHGFVHVNFNERILYLLETSKWFNAKNETGINCDLIAYEIPKYQSFADTYNKFEMNSTLHFCSENGYNFSREMSEFEKNLYIFTGGKVKSYMVEGHVFDTLNVTKEFSVLMSNIRGERALKLVDPRVQRRKQDGHYLCDRTDCTGGCEVHPNTGDTCVA